MGKNKMKNRNFNYQYAKFRKYYSGWMLDEELNKMVEDLSIVLREVELCINGKIDPNTYHKTASNFKKKWLKDAK